MDDDSWFAPMGRKESLEMSLTQGGTRWRGFALGWFTCAPLVRRDSDLALPELKNRSPNQSRPGRCLSCSHFVCDGRATLNLEPGEYSYETERGPEFDSARGRFSVAATTGSTNLT